MSPETLGIRVTSHNSRSGKYTERHSSVVAVDTCATCGAALKRGASRFCSQTCYHATRRRPIADRFWPKVRKTDTCWLWTGSVFGSLGYGQVPGRRGELPRYAHRVSWELHRGPVPDGMHVLHACDVPRCVNPDHLFLGTHKENMADASRKGRLSVPRPRRQRVSDAEVSQMRQMGASGMTGRAIASAFGVSTTYVSLVLAGKRRSA